ncbi:MAG: hypothetical protein MRY21_05815 [Simkaniaceae bacterium]|nr:hypothetical protein [Simkaniaceae bacterium]
MKHYALLLLTLLLVSCNKQEQKFCKSASAKSMDPNFKIWCPTKSPSNFLPTAYGEGTSPPIMWKGLPIGTTHLKITLLDATCTYNCDSCCQYRHWVLEIPLHDLSETGPITPGRINAGASEQIDSLYAKPNSAGKKSYTSFAPPPSQVHAYIYQAVAMSKQGSKVKVLGYSQSDPMLFRIKK